MSPFSEVFMHWLLPLVAAGWGVVVVATPPPVQGKEENIPYVVGNLEAVMPTLEALVEGGSNPSPSMLPIRLLLLPRFVSPPPHPPPPSPHPLSSLLLPLLPPSNNPHPRKEQTVEMSATPSTPSQVF